MKKSIRFSICALFLLIWGGAHMEAQTFNVLHEMFPVSNPSSPDATRGFDVIEATNGDIVVGGKVGQSGDYGLLLASFNSDGTLKWSKAINPFGSANIVYEVRSICEILDPSAPGYAIVGQAQKPNGNNTGVIVTTDLAGNVVHSFRNPTGDDYSDVIFAHGYVYALGNYISSGTNGPFSDMILTRLEPVSGALFNIVDQSSLRSAAGSTEAVALEAAPNGQIYLLGDLYDVVQAKNFVYASRYNPSTLAIEAAEIFKFKEKPAGSPWINHAGRPEDMCVSHGGNLMILCQVGGEDAYNLLEIDLSLGVIDDWKDLVATSGALSARGRHIEAISGSRYLIAGVVERFYTGPGGPTAQKDGFMHLWDAGFATGTARDFGQPYFWDATDDLWSAVEAANGEYIGTGRLLTPSGSNDYLRLTRIDNVPTLNCDDQTNISMASTYTTVHTITRTPRYAAAQPLLTNDTTTAARSSHLLEECTEGANYMPPVPKRSGTVSPEATSAWLYPNPSQGQVSLVSDFEGEVLIYDLNGRLMHRAAVTEGEQPVDLTELPAGVYMVRLQGVEGEQKTQRIVLTD